MHNLRTILTLATVILKTTMHGTWDHNYFNTLTKYVHVSHNVRTQWRDTMKLVTQKLRMESWGRTMSRRRMADTKGGTSISIFWRIWGFYELLSTYTIRFMSYHFQRKYLSMEGNCKMATNLNTKVNRS